MQSNISCMSSPIEFRANGKLMLTGEYLVLLGARSLAMPLRLGQAMTIEESSAGVVDWESTAPGGRWFTARFHTIDFRIITASNQSVATGLQCLLLSASKLNPDFLNGSPGFRVKVSADYPLEWGLGSSSTLCYLIASWANVDSFQLYRMVSNGSGYDIACASRKEMIYYTLSVMGREIVNTTPGLALKEHAYFAYLGKKQNSYKEVSEFLNTNRHCKTDVERISQLSSLICEARTPENLIDLVDEHEAIVSHILDRPVTASRFPYFPGTVKSLGAWGGDFGMFISGLKSTEVFEILHHHGFDTLFKLSDIAASV